MVCGNKRSGEELRCNRCGSPFEIRTEFRYRDRIADNFPYIKSIVSLGECETPVFHADGFDMKIDYMLPTFSYKDRGSRVLISHIADIRDSEGITRISEDSSGNAGASIAAYGSAAGLAVDIYVPETVAGKKFSQIQAYGAHVIRVNGSREDVQAAAERSGSFYASHVLRPEFRDGIRTLAYEIFRQFDRMPENIYIPVSAGTLLLGLYSGLKHLMDSGEIDHLPRIIAVQTEAVSPLCARINGKTYDPDNKLSSIADALVSRRPILIEKMHQVISDHGRCITVDDDEIMDARNKLARKGFLVEYSSATVYAAFRKKPLEKSLLVMTGSGLKNDS
ncbi:pyridoxal-phosphate dependent enzyme [Thermoplasma sp.]|uniref:pyridoxal-phosphate dependent enzyme n=1 Tax=Thermoplasma sp. TaxID=1973142 RepID=UPI00127664A3|nr:pyridoxal-phosphate dependent enzyme [Thermoplasma sp.]KAA8923421.1 MAG: pyridoxal-phosphate dependent enzyme [Thermoplasma sp.]